MVSEAIIGKPYKLLAKISGVLNVMYADIYIGPWRGGKLELYCGSIALPFPEDHSNPLKYNYTLRLHALELSRKQCFQLPLYPLFK